MGLDIYLIANNQRELDSKKYPVDDNENLHKHSLSRTFCKFMSRQNVINHQPELDQIGKITGIDILPIYQMEEYPDAEELEYVLDTTESEEEKQEIIRQNEEEKLKLQGNIDKVLSTVIALIEKLNEVENLPSLLLPTNRDTLGNAVYFSEFQLDKGDGYIGNNFGQDLRNFKRFLEFAKERETTTVWFMYA